MEYLKHLMVVECIGWAKAAGTPMRFATIATSMVTLGDTALRCPNMT